jgi:hypothetical protein
MGDHAADPAVDDDQFCGDLPGALGGVGVGERVDRALPWQGQRDSPSADHPHLPRHLSTHKP